MGTLHEQIFNQIHTKNLVYNTCWEDPHCDRTLLQLGPDSNVVMLTSAGCNALDYLLDDPASIHCVDVNPRQNALLELKMACFASGNNNMLWELFGNGRSEHAPVFFQQALSPHLSTTARRYWEKNLRYFDGKGWRNTFYWHGTSGAVAWMVRQWIQRRPAVRDLAEQLFKAETLAEQQYWFDQFEPEFLKGFMRRFLKSHLVQSMLGVPKSQQKLANARYEDGMCGYVRDCLKHVFTARSFADNYFWKVYFTGAYTPDCCPGYLQKENFSSLKNRVSRLNPYTGTLSRFLQENPGQYTHFILLDHQDWLAAHHHAALIEEWQLILKNAAPGAKILMRSAAPEPDFVPNFVKKTLVFEKAAVEAVVPADRVGTYAGTWLWTLPK